MHPGPRRRHSPGLPSATTRRCASRLRISTRPNSPRCRSRGSTLSMRRRAPWVRRSSSTPTSPAVGPSRVASCHRPEHGFASPLSGATRVRRGARPAPGANVVQCGLSGALFLGWTCAIAGAASAVAGGNASRVEQRLGCRAHLSQHRASYPYWQGVPAGARLLHRILRRGVQR